MHPDSQHLLVGERKTARKMLHQDRTMTCTAIGATYRTLTIRSKLSPGIEVVIMSELETNY